MSSTDATLDGTCPRDVEADDDVRHFDQLSDRAQRVVAAADADWTHSVDAPTPALTDADVVVFTDYYRVE
ncbi:hypothetical protein [Salinigranum sp. GCM10025319]|uniref:hypothetical protein n=1 Tax=Salinigranum sp. GCM10025319 TaxID=3252687 RepID=UPI00360FB202